MKFKTLRIRNIASIANAVINFDEEPLVSTPLFLIYGPTGSGKTTILDSICLALYNAAPRLDSLNQKKRQFDDDFSGKGVRNVNDASNLIRYGAVESFVELVFVGNDSKEYIALWSARIGRRGQTKGKLLDIDRRLSMADSDVIWERKPEIERIILSPDVVGMSYDNFLRTTLLPQGAFNRFLSAGRSEKGEILEKIVGLNRFTEIGQRITRSYKEVSAKKSILEERIKKFELLSEGQQKELEQELIELNDIISIKQKEVSDLDSKVSWIEKSDLLLNTVERAKADFEYIKNEVESTEFIETSGRLEIREALSPVRNLDKEIKKATYLLESNQNEMKNLSSERTILLQSRKSYEVSFRQFSKDALIGKVKLATYSTQSKLIDNEKLALKILDAYDRISEKLKKLLELSPQMDEVISQATEEVNSAKSTFLKITKEEELASIRKEELDNEIDKQSLSPLVKYSDLLGTQKIILEIDLLRQKELNHSLVVKQLTEKYKEADENYQRIELSTHDAAQSLRSKLEVGDRCPVCYSVVKEIVTNDFFVDLLRVAEEPRKKAREAVDEATVQLNIVQANLKSKVDILHETGLRTDEQIKEVGDLLRKVFEEIDDINSVKELIEKSNKAIEFINDKNTSLIKQVNLLNELSKKSKLASEKKSLAEIKLSKIIQEKDNNVKNILDYQKELEELRMGLVELFGNEGESDTKLLRKRLIQLSTDYSSLAEKNEKAVSIMNEYSNLVRIIDNALDRTSPARFDDCIGAEVYDSADIAGICDELTTRFSIINGKILSSTELIESLCETKAEITDTLPKNLRNHLDDATLGITDEEYDWLKKEQQSKLQLLSERDSVLIRVKKEYADLLDKRPFGPEDNDVDLQILRERLDSSRQDISLIDQKIGSIKERLNTNNERLHKLEVLTGEYNELCHKSDIMATLNSNFGESHFRDVICEYILSHLLINSNFYLSRFSNRYSMFTQPGNLEVMIHDAETGEDRVFSTLSGGETFMASLALALGLSALQSVADTPDIFFIDEGFGSLSSECLESVMNTLDSLRRIESRRVGIVSHVEALRDRIAVRISVQRQGAVSAVKVETGI